MKLKNKYISKIISIGLIFGIVSTSIPIYSFANDLSIKENIYSKKNNNIQTKKEDLQKPKNSNEANTWITGLSDMPTQRMNFASSVVNGKIYAIGGSTSSSGNSHTNKVEVYDPETNEWETKTSMPTSRSNLTSSVVNEKIYVIGGFNNSDLNTVEMYDPETDKWETKASMPTPKNTFTSSVVDGKIYCIGGYKGSSYLNTVEVYDPETDKWETKSSMPTSRLSLTSSVVDGKIYCIGGSNTTLLNTVEVYNPKTDTWEIKSSMPTARRFLASAEVEGKIYTIGGTDNISYLNTVEVYNPSTDKWETKASMPTARYGLRISVVNGKIYCIGGRSTNGYSKIVEAYIVPTIEELKNFISNIDIYIKPENSLHMTLSTNLILFDDYMNIDDAEIQNAVEINVTSTLPYQLNTYLLDEIYNNDRTKKIDMYRLNIKSNKDTEYKKFTGINSKLVLEDNCEAGDSTSHLIDLKLEAGDTYQSDIYKTVIKFEAEQK